MITIDEAIVRFKQEQKRQLERIDMLEDVPMFGSSPEDKELIDNCYKNAEEYGQIAEWLKKYKEILEIINKFNAIVV
jgi:hypothetical protein